MTLNSLNTMIYFVTLILIPCSLVVFSVLATPAAWPFHLDLWGGHCPLSIGAVHLDGAHLADGAGLQEAGDTQGHLPHSASWDLSPRYMYIPCSQKLSRGTCTY